ncbi:MAG: aldehyde dehydrogenase family protein [Nitrososphaerota archaeon]
MSQPALKNFVNGRFKPSSSQKFLPAYNPAFGTVIAWVPVSTPEEVDEAVESGVRAFERFSKSTPSEKVGYLYRLRSLIERDAENLAQVLVDNHGRTLEEARGEVKRSLENIEAAAAIAYTLAKGEKMMDISPDVDQELLRAPLGCFAIVTPFNIPMHAWSSYVPYAIALGCTVVLKPSEVTPLVVDELSRLVKEAGVPDGVVSVLHGDASVVEHLVSHPHIVGVGFIGSTRVGKHLYEMAARYGKRASINAGAKNHIVVMPDAVLDKTIPTVVSSFFGMSGQRCLAGSVLVGVGGLQLRDRLVSSSKLRLGYGMDKETEMGPMASAAGLERVSRFITIGEETGGRIILDGRQNKPIRQLPGYFIGPTIFTDVPPTSPIAREEIFGPVATLLEVPTLDEAIELINNNTPYGNAAAIFTSNPRAARHFVTSVEVGNVGVNIGVPQPMAYFPLGGRKQSFFGNAHSRFDTLRFYTDHKIVTTRWW